MAILTHRREGSEREEAGGFPSGELEPFKKHSPYAEITPVVIERVISLVMTALDLCEAASGLRNQTNAGRYHPTSTFGALADFSADSMPWLQQQ